MTEKKGKEKGRKKKGKRKTDDLELILASVETLTAEVIKLVEEFDAFKLDPKRRGPPGPRGPEGPMGPQGPGYRRSQEVEKKKAAKKKAVTRKVASKQTTKKAAPKKTPAGST